MPEGFTRELAEAVNQVFRRHAETWRERMHGKHVYLRIDPVWLAGESTGGPVWVREGNMLRLLMTVKVEIPIQEEP